MTVSTVSTCTTIRSTEHYGALLRWACWVTCVRINHVRPMATMTLSCARIQPWTCGWRTSNFKRLFTAPVFQRRESLCQRLCNFALKVCSSTRRSPDSTHPLIALFVPDAHGQAHSCTIEDVLNGRFDVANLPAQAVLRLLVPPSQVKTFYEKDVRTLAGRAS